MQSKRPRFNPLILALALAAVLMVWSVLGGTGSASNSSMEYSTVVHYFESLQVTQFLLDLNTGVTCPCRIPRPRAPHRLPAAC